VILVHNVSRDILVNVGIVKIVNNMDIFLMIVSKDLNIIVLHAKSIIMFLCVTNLRIMYVFDAMPKVNILSRIVPNLGVHFVSQFMILNHVMLSRIILVPFVKQKVIILLMNAMFLGVLDLGAKFVLLSMT
jgi:hypothetical protein